MSSVKAAVRGAKTSGKASSNTTAHNAATKDSEPVKKHDKENLQVLTLIFLPRYLFYCTYWMPMLSFLQSFSQKLL